MNALEIKGLGKVYRGRKLQTVTALTDLSLMVPAGEVFGFLGPNGAGKSTTIKIIMGLIRATSGEALAMGLPVSDPAARLRIGYLPENPSFYDFLTAREYLHFVGVSFRMSEQLLAARSIEVLGKLELEHAADRPIRGYSKGMVQRLGLAQALLHDPDLYILDEPMSGLDPLGRALVKELIRELQQRGKTIFFSTHITADVEAVCNRVGVIVNGELRAVDLVENILERGIEGYTVHLKNLGVRASLDRYALQGANDSSGVFYAPRESFKEFMEEVIRSGAEIDLIEPVRKDVEKFFLEIVGKG